MTVTPRVPMNLVFETHATSLDNEAGLASGWFAMLGFVNAPTVI
jgi:hypothetical protein